MGELAQQFEDYEKFDEGENCLDQMEKELLKYKGDKIIDGLTENVVKRKKMLQNTKVGVSNNCNVKAFTKNMVNSYNNQECATNFMPDMYQNRNQVIMSKKLKSMKNNQF